MVVYLIGELYACTAGLRGIRRTSLPNYEATTLSYLPTGRYVSSWIITGVYTEQ